MTRRKPKNRVVVMELLKTGHVGDARSISKKIGRPMNSVTATLTMLHREGWVKRTPSRPFVYGLASSELPAATSAPVPVPLQKPRTIQTNGGFVTLEADKDGFLLSGDGPVNVRFEPDMVVVEIMRK